MDSKSCKFIPARRPPALKVRDSRVTSTRSSAPERIRDSAIFALGLGTPQFYHKASAEAGGATPNRNFSYYVGIGGYGQDFRYVDQQNGAGYTYLGAPAIATNGSRRVRQPHHGVFVLLRNNGAAGPGGYALFPYQYGFLSNIANRDVIANAHIAIPHKHDAGKDDIQLLFDSGYLNNSYYSSPLDAGGLTSSTELPRTFRLEIPTRREHRHFGLVHVVGSSRIGIAGLVLNGGRMSEVRKSILVSEQSE